MGVLTWASVHLPSATYLGLMIMPMPCHGEDDVAVNHEIVTGVPLGRVPLSTPSSLWSGVGISMPPAIPYLRGIGYVTHTPMPGWPSIGMTCGLLSPV